MVGRCTKKGDREREREGEEDAAVRGVVATR